ncbi:hypothetical protein DN408_02035 [Bacillus sp. AR13-1]|nr:hypothetical protein DN408_02035 [Bacillus sp. AR13-1]
MLLISINLYIFINNIQNKPHVVKYNLIHLKEFTYVQYYLDTFYATSLTMRDCWWYFFNGNRN